MDVDQSVTMRIGRKPGEKMEVDWAGTKMTLVDRATGEVSDACVFVACMPFSGKLFAEGLLSMDSESWLAAPRDRTFFTLGEPDAALAEKAGETDAARLARKPGSRGSVFESQERGALSPLQGTPFQVCSWERATVRSNYHVPAMGCFYSVPFEHIGKVADVRITRDAVEAFVGGVRVASHPRSYVGGDYVTRAGHMPENHVAHLEWNVEGLMRRASEAGPSCERAMAVVTGSQSTKKQSKGQGKALLALSRRCGASTLEGACASALAAAGGATCAVAAVECLCGAAYRANGDAEDSGERALLRGSGTHGRDGE